MYGKSTNCVVVSRLQLLLVGIKNLVFCFVDFPYKRTRERIYNGRKQGAPSTCDGGCVSLINERQSIN